MRTVIAILLFSFTLGMTACYLAGFFDPLKVQCRTEPARTLVYREYTGPINGARGAANNVRAHLRTLPGVRIINTAIEYKNAPLTANEKTVQCKAGCLVDSLPASSLTPPYMHAVLPQSEALCAEFRYRSFFSYMTATMKFFPNIVSLLKQHQCNAAGPVLEIHDTSSRQIRYVVPVTR